MHQGNLFTPVQRLVRLVSRTHVGFEPLCDRLGLTPRKTRALIGQARREGFAVDVAGEDVALRPSLPKADVATVQMPVQKAGKPHSFVVASDLHFGSKYHLRAQLIDHIGTAYEQGVRVCLLPGDLLDGCYRHGRWELTSHGFQDQADDFLTGLPKHKGLRYVGITGNHDETFEKESGLIVHHALNDMARAKGRKDFTLLGARGAFVCLRAPGERRGLVVDLWHPIRGPAYALTYGMQKKVEGYAPGKKPNVLLVGHWHQSAYFNQRGVHAMSCGTFQGGGSSFGKALGGAPSIGGWRIKYALTKDGTVRDFTPTWHGYFETEVPQEVAI